MLLEDGIAASPFPRERFLREEEKDMPKVSEIYGSGDALKFDDLQGKPHTVVIESARVHHWPAKDGMPEKDAIILTFVGREKELSLSPTSARVLAQAFGDDTGLWITKTITLFPNPGSTPKYNSVGVLVPDQPAGVVGGEGTGQPVPEPPGSDGDSGF